MQPLRKSSSLPLNNSSSLTSVPDHVYSFATRLVRRTRPQGGSAPDWLKPLVSWGAGPRAGQYLVLGAKARALLEGRFHVTTDDIKAVAHPVLRHRLVTTFAAQSEGMTPDRVIDQLLDKIPVELNQRAEKLARG